MSKDQIPETNTEPTSAGLKRRDLLLSGSSLVAASTPSAIGLTSPAQAQQPATASAPAGQRPNIVVIKGVGIRNLGAWFHYEFLANLTSRGDIEMRKIIGAAAFVAVVFTAMPASTQENDPYDYPYCLQGGDYGLPGLCQFTSYAQCQATAWGTRSYCGINPRFAYFWQPRGRRAYLVR